MLRVSTLFCCLFVFFFITPAALPQKMPAAISDFKIQALYRAAKLTWKAGVKGPVSVQILRSDMFEDGPYKEVETVRVTPGKTAYEYVDKSMGAEAKFFYKLSVKETGETLGPLPTRPFFSPPAT